MEKIEIEFKLIVKKDTYVQFIHDYKDHDCVTYQQTNHYLSCPKLDKLKYMLRIRDKDNHYELTLKRPNDVGRKEFNIDIDEETKDMIFNGKEVDNEIFKILLKEDIMVRDLEHDMTLTTIRTDITLDNGVLSLDDNFYGNHEDFEIEFEVKDSEKGYKDFLNLIKPYNLDYKDNCMSKYMRMKKAR